MTLDPLTLALAAALEPTLRRVVGEAVAAAMAQPPGAATADNSLLTIQAVASRLATSPATVRRMIAAGDLPVVKLGRSVRIRAADLDRVLR